jgi:hypothetical protein
MIRTKSLMKLFSNSIVNHIFFISTASDAILLTLLKEVQSLYH